MNTFEYASPTRAEDVVKLLAGRSGSSAVLGGGTDLLCLMKDYIESPERLVSLRSVQALKEIRYDDGQGLTLGSGVTLDAIANHEQVRRHYPALAALSAEVGGPQIRNVGTLGGTLCQRPRCWYYRSGFGLLAQREGRSMVPEGDNRYHAILGNSGPAYFVNPSTLAPILIALGAKARILSESGSREIGLAELYVTPSRSDQRELSVGPEELLTEVQVPPPAGRRVGAYEVRQRLTLDWPLVSAAVVLSMSGDSVSKADVILGMVAPTPWRAGAAESFLAGKTVSSEVAEQAGEAASEGANPLSRNAYKVQLARVSVKRALLRAVGREV